ncbi:hypothetical protein [Flavobacterium sp.]|uniref:hypothetical protein n=1 Tax=Flavobacterium sp. TaxID=239 RepID=UPI004047A9B3
MIQKLVLALFISFSSCNKNEQGLNNDEQYRVIHSLIDEINKINKSQNIDEIQKLYYKPDFISMDNIANLMYENIGIKENQSFSKQLESYKNFNFEEKKIKKISLIYESDFNAISGPIVLKYHIIGMPFFSKTKDKCLLSIGERSTFLDNGKLKSESHGFYIQMIKIDNIWKIQKKIGNW